MAGEWKEVTVADIAATSPNALATGPFGSAISSRFFQAFGVPVIRGSNLTDTIDERLVEDGFAFVSPEKAAEFSRSLARCGDLIFTCWGTIGQVGLIDKRARYDEYVISNKQMKLTPDPARADSLFLYYLFSGPVVSDEIRNQAIGSSVPGFNLGQLKSIRLRLPPLSQQQEIARILGNLDDKIELNRHMDETLEAMARALFKSWFVDFDPVRAKAEGRTPSGMAAETAKLFPSEFVDSERGPIPLDWRVGAVGDYVTLKRGTTYKGALVGAPGPALLGLGSIRPGGGFRSDGFKTYGGECPPELMLGPGDIYVSLKGATKDGEMIGSVARVPNTVASGRLTQDTVKLQLRVAEWSRYVYRLLLTPYYRTYCANHATGSAVVALSREDFLSYPMIVPSAEVLRQFNTLLSALEARAEQCLTENDALARVRDELLPRLLSGELPVAHAERAIEATG